MNVVFRIDTMNNTVKKVEIEPRDRHWIQITIRDNDNTVSAIIRGDDFIEAYNGCEKYFAEKKAKADEHDENTKKRLKEIQGREVE